MRDRKTALLWAVAWFFGRRWLRRRAALAVAGVAAGASARRGRIRAVLGAVALVGALAGAFVVWRRLAGETQHDEWVASDGSAPLVETPAAAPSA
jgi:disulfide bond formation protein DsbB